MKRSDLKIKPRRVGRGGNPELAVYYHLNPNTKKTKKGKGKDDDLRHKFFNKKFLKKRTTTEDVEDDLMKSINKATTSKVRPSNLQRSQLREIKDFGQYREAVPTAFSDNFTQPQEFAPLPDKFKGMTKPVDPDFRRKALAYRKDIMKDLNNIKDDAEYFEMQDKLDSINKYLGNEYTNQSISTPTPQPPRSTIAELKQRIAPEFQKPKMPELLGRKTPEIVEAQFPKDADFRSRAMQYSKELMKDLQKTDDRSKILEIREKIEKINKALGVETQNVNPMAFPDRPKTSKMFSAPSDTKSELLNEQLKTIQDKGVTAARTTRNKIMGKPKFPEDIKQFQEIEPELMDISFEGNRSSTPISGVSSPSTSRLDLSKVSRQELSETPSSYYTANESSSYLNDMYDKINRPNSARSTPLSIRSESPVNFTDTFYSEPGGPSRPLPIRTSTPLDSSFNPGETPYNTQELFPTPISESKPKVFYSKPGVSSRPQPIDLDEITRIAEPTPPAPTPTPSAIEDLSDAPRKVGKSWTPTLKSVGSFAGNALTQMLVNEGVRRYAKLFDWEKDTGSDELKEKLKMQSAKTVPSDSIGAGINTY